MKKLLLLLCPLTLIFMFSSCDIELGGDMIWDFVNPDIIMTVKDKSGNDLLDPEFEGNILDSGITVDFAGDVYELKTGENDPEYTNVSRATYTDWKGLRTSFSDYFQTNLMLFGQFKGDGEHHKKKFIINWGDGSKDTVEFDLYITWNKRHTNPTSHWKIYLNGKEYNKGGLKIDFVK